MWFGKYRLARGSKLYHCGAKRIACGGAFYYLLLLASWGAAAGAAFLVALSFTLPDINHAMNERRAPSITILDRNGAKVASLNDLYGEPVDMEDLPEHVWQAIVAVEDKRYFSHFGIDPMGLGRAVVRNISGRPMQGGSTISQQLAKNLFLTRERTVIRKLQEVLLTLWLEHRFTKRQILSLYMNRISFNGTRYGIAAAAEDMFGAAAGELSIAQAAVLAAQLKAPSYYQKNPDRAWARAEIVLALMRKQGHISEAEHKLALSYRHSAPPREKNQTRYFIDHVLSELYSRVPVVDSDTIVRTALDLPLQKTAERAVAGFVEQNGAKYGFSEGAALFMDTDGGVIAMVGGRDYSKSQFNRATIMRRQPGSAFKPFVWLAGIKGGMKPGDMFDDRPSTIAGWTPRNHDNKYLGRVSMEDALSLSLNTIAVQIAGKVGLASIISTARSLGLVDDMSRDYTVILGSSEVSLMDLASAYGAFATGGRGFVPYTITSVEDAGGGGAKYVRIASERTAIMSAEDAAYMHQMLKAVVERGTGREAGVKGLDIAGKTGTSQDNRDAWFFGYSPFAVGGVWIGNDSGAPMSQDSYGGTIPAKMFKAIMGFAGTRRGE